MIKLTSIFRRNRLQPKSLSQCVIRFIGLLSLKNDFNCIFFHPEAGKLVINLALTKSNLKELRRKQSLKIVRKVVRHNRSTPSRKINQKQLLSEYLRHLIKFHHNKIYNQRMTFEAPVKLNCLHSILNQDASW